MIALVAAMALAQLDAGVLDLETPWSSAAVPPRADAPLSSWMVVPAGSTLHEEAVCAPSAVAVVTAKDLAATRAERDAALQEVQAGGGSTLKWALVSLGVGFAAGALAATAGIVAWHPWQK